jgi:hypothetical protein
VTRRPAAPAKSAATDHASGPGGSKMYDHNSSQVRKATLAGSVVISPRHLGRNQRIQKQFVERQKPFLAAETRHQ